MNSTTLRLIDGRDPPFFFMDVATIDDGLSLEAVAVLAYIKRFPQASAEEIRNHYGVATHHIEIALTELAKAGFVTFGRS